MNSASIVHIVPDTDELEHEDDTNCWCGVTTTLGQDGKHIILIAVHRSQADREFDSAHCAANI